MRLSGRTALVTGAARGIGYAIAEELLAEGARVVLSDVLVKEGEAAAKTLSSKGETLFVAGDVGDAASVEAVIAAAVKRFGTIDSLVNNAGVVHKADFLDLTEADFDRVLRINLKGAFLMGQAVARRMVEDVKAGKQPGAVVNMASVNARVAIPDQVPYAISKGGLVQLTNVMALALSEYGIRVNAIGPGSIMTDMMKTLLTDDAARRKILSRTPLRRFAQPSEVAKVVGFLLSDEASYITGETIYVDGGRLGLNYTVSVPDDA